MADSEIDLAEKRGYAKGYTAGKRRRVREAQLEHHRARETARLDRFMCAAMTGLLAREAPWQKGGVLDGNADDFADTARDIARAMLRKNP